MLYVLETISYECGDYALAASLNLVHAVINLMQLLVPILLVASLIIVLIRIVVSPDDKKSNKRLLNVLLASLLCFLIPTILSIVLSFLPDDFAGLDIGACWRNAYNADYGDPNDDDKRVIGLAMSRLTIDLTSLKNATPPAGSGSPLAKCGETNLAGVQVQCINGSGKNIDVANFALSFEGYPYVWGGKGQDLTRANYNAIKANYPNAYYNDARMEQYLDKGMLAWDCSGFVHYVYAHFGYQIGWSTGDQINDGTRVASLSEAKPGDLLVNSHHVAMYVGNNKIVHAKGTDYGTVVTDVSMSGYTIRRIIQ